MTTGPHAAVAATFRREHGQVLATLVGDLGDIDLAEDALAEAFAVASRTWPQRGVPPNPGGWITTTARRRAIDRLRRESQRGAREAEAVELAIPVERDDARFLHDDRLRLLFTCCHPALAQHARVALTLRLLCGLSTPEIARAFLVPEATMAQRIVRAKRKIRDAGIPYRVPDAEELPARLRSVLAVVYLVANEGHTASSGDDLARVDLVEEAVRLARLLVTLLPEEPEVTGLLALLLLTAARLPARTDADGRLVLLADQDRSCWDAALVDEGLALVRACLQRGRPGPYQLQAAINAVHCSAPSAGQTDWRQVLALYDRLLVVAPTPVVALNRAVALAEVEGPAVALAEVDGLDLDDYHPRHAVRAELLRRLGRLDEAADAYRTAAAATANGPERAFLSARAADLR